MSVDWLIDWLIKFNVHIQARLAYDRRAFKRQYMRCQATYTVCGRTFQGFLSAFFLFPRHSTGAPYLAHGFPRQRGLRGLPPSWINVEKYSQRTTSLPSNKGKTNSTTKPILILTPGNRTGGTVEPRSLFLPRRKQEKSGGEKDLVVSDIHTL